MKSGVYERNLGTREESLVCILRAASSVNILEDQLRRTTRDLRTRVAKCTEVDGGFLERLLSTVTDLLFNLKLILN